MPKEVGETISERILGANQYLTLVILESEEKIAELKDAEVRCGKAYFFQVKSYSPFRYGPFVPIDEDGNEIDSIDPEAGLDYTPLRRLYEDAGDYLFENDSEPWLLLHYSIAVQQSYIWIYPSIPNTQKMGVFPWQIAGMPDPTVGHKYGYIPGYEMEWDDPPVSLEMVAFMDIGKYVSYGFWNSDVEKKAKPILMIKGRAYNTIPIVDEEMKKAIWSGKIRSTKVSLGPVYRPFDLRTPNKWDDCYMKLEGI